MKLVHYGDLNGGVLLDADMDVEPRKSFNKPRHKNILWASPVDSAYGWKDWCEAESFGDLHKQKPWLIELSEDARVYTVRDIDDLSHLVAKYPGETRYAFSTDIDWLSVSRDFDAVYLTEDGQWETRLSTPDLYGWDCESVAVFRAAAVCRVLEEPQAIPFVEAVGGEQR